MKNSPPPVSFGSASAPTLAVRQPGFHGKLPSRGDFVAFGLTGAFLAAWDLWVSAGLEATRTAYGADWEYMLDGGPVWRFALPPGLLSAAGVAGVMHPSRDRVERRFPFVIACELPLSLSTAAAPVLCRSWYARAELAVRVLVAREAEPATARRAVNALGSPTAGEAAQPAAAESVVVDLLGPTVPNQSFWWSRGVGGGKGRRTDKGGVAAAPGMPTADMFVALLDGEWTAHGWADLDDGAPAAPPPAWIVGEACRSPLSAAAPP